MEEISSSLSEIRANNQWMLAQCSKVCDTTQAPACQCKLLLEQANKELYDLEERCRLLENKCTRQEKDTDTIVKTIKSLNKQLGTLQTHLQTGDAKLKNRRPPITTETVLRSEPLATCHSSTAHTHTEQHGQRESPKQSEQDKQIEHTTCVQTQTSTNDESVSDKTFDNEVHFDDSDGDSVFGGTFVYGEDHSTTTQEEIGSTDQTSHHEIGATSTVCDSHNQGSGVLPYMTPSKVDVVQQVKQQVVFGDIHWGHLAKQEHAESRLLFNELDGVHTVLCIDISESMLENNGWEQTSIFVKDYLNGQMQVSVVYGIQDQHIAMVTFGHETAVKQRYTDNYNQVSQLFDTLKLGGPSTLYGGIMMCGAAVSCSRYIGVHYGSGLIVPSRIVIITDGRPSDIRTIAGPDDPAADQDMAKRLIINKMSEIDFARHDIFIVPVGNADMDFIEVMLGVTDGMKLEYTQGKRFSKRAYLAIKAADEETSLFGTSLFYLRDQLSAEDEEDIKSILERSKRCNEMSKLALPPPLPVLHDIYHEKRRSQLPTVGSRVRRGPDWKWKDEEDNMGPGTVIGHYKDGDEVWIIWDSNDGIRRYRYGEHGYDVLIVDEQRELVDGNILAIGCNVKPGKRWNKPEPKPKRGVVVRIDPDKAKATVRWDNARRGDYSNDLSKGELEYCPNLERYTEDC